MRSFETRSHPATGSLTSATAPRCSSTLQRGDFLSPASYTATGEEQDLSSALTRLVARFGEPVIRKGVDVAMRMMGEEFVKGQTIEEAIENSRKLEQAGFRYSYDMLGEAATTAEGRRPLFCGLRAGHSCYRSGVGRSRYLQRPRHIDQTVGAPSALFPLASRPGHG